MLREKNMVETLKFVYLLILFISIFVCHYSISFC